MTERKPPAVSWESFVERQIREAQEAGEFDSLPGFGKPIPDIDEPYDENWWLKKKARQEKISLSFNPEPSATASRNFRGRDGQGNEKCKTENAKCKTGQPRLSFCILHSRFCILH
jgi:hypothetical protein